MRQHRTAQSLVEFAIVGPLFFLLIFGIIEGGRLIWTNHTLENATKEGARYTTVRGRGSIQSDAPASDAKVEAHMLDVSTGLDPGKLSVNLVLLDGDMADRSRFRVDTSYEYDFVITSIFGLEGVTLKASSTDMFWRDAAD